MADFVEQAIAANKVCMLSWEQCPYCVRAKAILEPIAPDLKVYLIDKMSNGDEIKNAVYKKYNHETVPAIFIDGNFIGGCSDIQELQQQGKLEAMVK